MGCNLFGGFGCRRHNDRDLRRRSHRFDDPRDMFPDRDRHRRDEDRDCPRCRSIFPRFF